MLMCFSLMFVDRKYPEVLSTLFALLEIEPDRRCIDNICAAACRLLTAHTDAVPVEQVSSKVKP